MIIFLLIDANIIFDLKKEKNAKKENIFNLQMVTFQFLSICNINLYLQSSIILITLDLQSDLLISRSPITLGLQWAFPYPEYSLPWVYNRAFSYPARLSPWVYNELSLIPSIHHPGYIPIWLQMTFLVLLSINLSGFTTEPSLIPECHPNFTFLPCLALSRVPWVHWVYNRAFSYCERLSPWVYNRPSLILSAHFITLF